MFPGLLAAMRGNFFVLGQQWALPGNGPASSGEVPASPGSRSQEDGLRLQKKVR